METKAIPGHRQYTITDTGIVTRIEGTKYGKHKVLKQSFHVVRGKEYPNGYMYVTLLTNDFINDLGELIDGTCIHNRNVGLHRLLARTFIPNDDPVNKNTVNHKDGNKLNNSLDNLEWMSHKDNIIHSISTGLKTHPKGKEHWKYGVKHTDKAKQQQRMAKLGVNHPKFKGYYINEHGIKYPSIRQAAFANGMDPKKLERIFKSGRNLSFGWSFEPKV